jgi:hypothetical protein
MSHSGFGGASISSGVLSPASTSSSDALFGKEDSHGNPQVRYPCKGDELSKLPFFFRRQLRRIAAQYGRDNEGTSALQQAYISPLLVKRFSARTPTVVIQETNLGALPLSLEQLNMSALVQTLHSLCRHCLKPGLSNVFLQYTLTCGSCADGPLLVLDCTVR